MLWRPSRIYLLFREALIGVLAASIGVTSVPAFAQPSTTEAILGRRTPPPISFGPDKIVDFSEPAPTSAPTYSTRIQADANATTLEFIDASIASALVQARYYGAPGLPPGPPNPYQLAQIEFDFSKLRPELENLFTRLSSATSSADLTAGISVLAFTAGMYFKLALRLETLRALMGQPLDPRLWPQRYALQIPLENFADYSFAQTLAQINGDFTNDEAIFSTQLDLSRRLLILSLNVRPIRSVEEIRLAANPSLATVQNMTQYFAADALLTNLLELNWRQGKKELLQIPEELWRKFPALRYRQLAFEETHRLLYNAQLAKLAQAEVPDILANLTKQNLTLVTPKLTREIIAITGSAEEMTDEKYESLTKALIGLEASSGTIAAMSLVSLINMPVVNVGGYNQLLSLAIAQAKAMVIRNDFLNNDSNPLSDEQVDQLRALLANEVESYRMKILIPLNAPANRLVDLYNRGETEVRKRLDDAFVKTAYEYQQLGQNDDITVDPAALAAALAAQIGDAGLSPAANNQFKRVLGSNNYEKARAEYTRMLMDHLYGFPGSEDDDLASYPDGTIRPEVLRDWIQMTKWQDTVWQTAAAKLNSAKPLTKGLGQTAKTDALAWVKAGEAVGFYKFRQGEPKVKDFKLSQAQRRVYFDTLKLRLEEEFPLFALKFDGPMGKETLVNQMYPPPTTNVNYSEYEFSSGTAVVIPDARNPEEVLQDAFTATEKLIKRNLRVVAGEERPFYDRAKEKLGFGTPQDLSSEFLTIISSSLPIARQIGTHPELARMYSRMLSNIAEVTWMRRAWDPLVKFNGQVMWAMIIVYLADALLKFPAPKVGSFISWLRSSSLVPSFGTSLNRLNNIVLGIFGLSLLDKGVEAFYLAPQTRDRLESFTTCKLDGPCVVNAGALRAWENEVDGLQSSWLFQLGAMAAFVLTYFGLAYFLSVKLPSMRLDRMTKSLQSKMRDIGFQNGQYSFNARDLNEMAESTISTLGPRSHPALNPNKALPQNLKGIESRPGEVRPNSTHKVAAIARAEIATRIRATVTEIQEMVRSQQVYWETWRARLKSQLILFNKEARFPSPEEFHNFSKNLEARIGSKQITPEVAAYLLDARREVATFIAPHYIRAETDVVYGALLKEVLGMNRNPMMFADDLASLKRYGSGFYTIQRQGSMVARDHQLVPFEQAARPGAPYRVELQRGRRTHVYRIENEKWLAYLRQFIEAKDVFPNSGLPQLKGPNGYKLIDGPKMKALFWDLGVGVK